MVGRLLARSGIINHDGSGAAGTGGARRQREREALEAFVRDAFGMSTSGSDSRSGSGQRRERHKKAVKSGATSGWLETFISKSASHFKTTS